MSAKVFVSFVSSGPGDPELLTLKAVRRLEEADAVLYDDLAAPALTHTKEGADLISVGKRAGRPSPRQQHVSRLLVDYAQTGQKIVRLKSGDAGIFGRLEEEVTALRKAGIGYEVIPGVTAASAAASAAGIPLTRRLNARRVQFITGHDVNGQLPDTLMLEALADPDAVTVVYMGKRTFGTLYSQLQGAGLAAQTPVLLADSVGTDSQRLTRTEVGKLAAKLASSEASGPAVIIFGALMDP